jgi:hypothetical protein
MSHILYFLEISGLLLSSIGSIRDLGYEIRKKFIPDQDPGLKKVAPDPGSGSARKTTVPDPQRFASPGSAAFGLRICAI